MEKVDELEARLAAIEFGLFTLMRVAPFRCDREVKIGEFLAFISSQGADDDFMQLAESRIRKLLPD